MHEKPTKMEKNPNVDWSDGWFRGWPVRLDQLKSKQKWKNN